MYRYAYDHFTCEYSHLSISLDKSLKGQDNCNTFVGKICRALAYLPFVYVVTIYRLFFIITTRLLLKIQSGWFYEDSLRSNSSEIVRGHLICGNIANKYELYRVSQQPRSQGLSPIRKTPGASLVLRTWCGKKRLPKNEVSASPQRDCTAKSQMLQEFYKPKQKTKQGIQNCRLISITSIRWRSK